MPDVVVAASGAAEAGGELVGEPGEVGLEGGEEGGVRVGGFRGWGFGHG